MKRKSVWLGKADEEAIRVIKDRYGCESESQAMRLALRTLAASPPLQIQLPPKPKHARPSPKDDENTLRERAAWKIANKILAGGVCLQCRGTAPDKRVLCNPCVAEYGALIGQPEITYADLVDHLNAEFDKRDTA